MTSFPFDSSLYTEANWPADVQAAQGTLRTASRSLASLSKDLEAAERNAKRSPAKWTPKIAEIKDLIALVDRTHAAARAVVDAYMDAARADQRAIFDGIAAIMIEKHAQDGILIIHRGGCSFEVMLAEDSPRGARFGYDASVDAPREKGWGAAREILPAHARWGGYSGMETTDDNRQMIRVLTIATEIAESLNVLFGL